jgi:hypothetical protein
LEKLFQDAAAEGARHLPLHLENLNRVSRVWLSKLPDARIPLYNVHELAVSGRGPGVNRKTGARRNQTA